MTTREASAQAMVQRAKDARESLAGALFEPGAVLTAIEAASEKGRTWLRLGNKQNLTDTKAWRRLLHRLTELGYVARIEWVMPLPGEDEEAKHAQLVIGWGPSNVVGMVSPASLIEGKGGVDTDT